MRTRKRLVMAGCVGMMLLAGFTGCTKTEEASQQTQEESGAEEDSQKTPDGTGDEGGSQKTPDGTGEETGNKETAGETGDEADRQETQSEPGGKADSQKTLDGTGEETGSKETAGETGDEADRQEPTNAAEHMDEQSAPFKLSPSEGTEHLGGKVQSVADEGMIFAQTTVMGEGENARMVTLVDEKDAQKIPVVFTADTKVEHWVIRDGGAGIDRADAALSDVKPGQGVELEGYYEGENFVATRILIEEYK